MIQHVIRSFDETFAWLATAYGVAWKDIAIATFGRWETKYWYPWLRDNGGKRLGANASVSTGYHWTWNPGMVINVPTSGNSLSTIYDAIAGLFMIRPGGPLVQLPGATPEPLGQAEPTPSGQPPVEPDPASPKPPAEQDPTQPAQAAVGGGLTMWLLVGVAAYFILSGKGKGKAKGKPRKKSAKRKTSRRRRR